MKNFDQDRDQVIKNAFQKGIEAILCPAEVSDAENLQTTLELIDKYKNIIASAGVHPHKADVFNPGCMETIKKLVSSKKICAVGEIGLDFHYNYSSPDNQKKAFRAQLNIAQDLTLPVIIHSRKAAKDIQQIIVEEKFMQGGVLHCFTEDWEFAEYMLDRNFYISFSGIVTYPSAFSLREVAKKVPVEKIFVETDSPFLTPATLHGKVKRNEPHNILETAEFLAELKNITFEELAEITTKNFKTLFKFE